MIRGPRDTVFSVEKDTYIISKVHMLVDAVYPDGLSMNTVVAWM